MLLFAFFGFDCHRWGLVSGCRILNHLTYSFVHANIWHLACNAYCMLAIMWTTGYRWKWLTALVIAVAVSFLAPCHTLTAGFSGVLFALVGITLAHGRLTLRRCLPVAISLAVSVILARNIAAGIHIMTFIIGFVTESLVEAYKELKKDSDILNGSSC